MPERSPLPPRLSRGHFVGLLFATVLSIGALIGAADADRRSIGVAIVPFGWQRLIVIHSLATLMLSWWLARILQRCQPKWQRRTSCWVYGAVGVAMAALTFFFGSHPAIVLEGSEPSYAWRMLARILWCAALQTPWCVVGFELSRADGASRPPLFSSANLFALAAITALGVPLSFLSVFLNQQAAVARDAWSRWKLADARVLVQRLKDVGCSTSLGERPTARDRGGVTTQITPARALADLQAACQIVKRQIDAMMAKPVRDEERRKLAQCYLALNRHDQAETILRPLADRDALVALDLARLLRERDRPEESRTWAATALRQSRA